MKNYLKKTLLLLFIIIFSISMLTACGNKAIGADVVSKVMFDLFIYNDPSSAKSIGISEEEAIELINNNKEITISLFKQMFISSGLQISDEKVSEIYDAQFNKLKETEYQIEELDTNGDSKTIKVSTTSIPTMEIGENAAIKFTEKVNNGEINDLNESGNILADLMIQEFNNATVNKEKSHFEVEFSLQKFDVNGKATNVWAPIDFNLFGQQLGSAVTGVIGK